MAEIFISYAHEDSEAARALAAALEQQGITAWWDRTMLAGADINLAIEEQLAEARKVLVIWSQRSIGSRWVRDEARHAAENGKLVPVRIDDCIVPLGFGHFHTVDIRDLNRDLPRLLPALQARTSGRAASPYQPVPASPAPPPAYQPAPLLHQPQGYNPQPPAPHPYAPQYAQAPQPAPAPMYAPMPQAAAFQPQAGAVQSQSQAASLFASFGRRFLAGVIDSVVLIAAFGLVAALMAAMTDGSEGGAVFSTLLFYAGTIAYYIVMMSERFAGQTLGYRAVGARLVDETTLKPVSAGKAALWLLVYSFTAFIGFIWYFIDDRKRMLHNIATNTVVVNAG